MVGFFNPFLSRIHREAAYRVPRSQQPTEWFLIFFTKNFINALKVKICGSKNLCSCKLFISVKNKYLPFQNEQPFHNKAVHFSSSVL